MVFAKAIFGGSQQRERTGDKRVHGSALEVSLDGEKFETTEWSLSGVQVANYFGPLATDDEVEGSLQLLSGVESYPFKAVVTRRDPTTGQLSLSFTDLSASGFSALEASLMGRYGL